MPIIKNIVLLTPWGMWKTCIDKTLSSSKTCCLSIVIATNIITLLYVKHFVYTVDSCEVEFLYKHKEIQPQIN